MNSPFAGASSTCRTLDLVCARQAASNVVLSELKCVEVWAGERSPSGRWLWQLCAQWVVKIAAGAPAWQLSGGLRLEHLWYIGKEEWGDVKGLLATKPTDLGPL